MTTTVFRLDDKVGRIGSDSRVSFIYDSGGVKRVFDSPDYFKIANIDGKLYGFAGANMMFKVFLMHYDYLFSDPDLVLDSLVAIAKENKIQFAMLRFDGELREFAYSPPQQGEFELLLTSKSKPLDTKYYAIGSGKHSKEYRKFRLSRRAQTPIIKIITANKTAIKKIKDVGIAKKIGQEQFSLDESRLLSQACQNHGGDIFTGGEVRIMENGLSITTADIAKNQVEILDNLDRLAKSEGAVCASPICAEREIENLLKLGVNPLESQDFSAGLNKSEIYKSISNAIKNTL